MRTNVALLRAGLLLALVPVGFSAFYARAEWQQSRENARRVAAAYDRIGPGMSAYQVQELFSRVGARVSVPEWPTRVGEVPGMEQGWFVVVESFDGQTRTSCRASPETPVSWQVWRVPGGHRWIAVGFIPGSLSEGSTAVAKRSGRGS